MVTYEDNTKEAQDAWEQFSKYAKENKIQLPVVVPGLLGSKVINFYGLFVAGFNAAIAYRNFLIRKELTLMKKLMDEKEKENEPEQPAAD